MKHALNRIWWALLCAAPALAQSSSLPMNTPTTVGGVELVCTGVGDSAQNDPRWTAYPLRVEVTGKGGQWLADADITVSNGKTQIVSAHCGGPWLLAKVPPGRYTATGTLEDGASASAEAVASATGQARAILRFPDEGGAAAQ